MLDLRTHRRDHLIQLLQHRWQVFLSSFPLEYNRSRNDTRCEFCLANLAAVLAVGHHHLLVTRQFINKVRIVRSRIAEGIVCHDRAAAHGDVLFVPVVRLANLLGERVF